MCHQSPSSLKPLHWSDHQPTTLQHGLPRHSRKTSVTSPRPGERPIASNGLAAAKATLWELSNTQRSATRNAEYLVYLLRQWTPSSQTRYSTAMAISPITTKATATSPIIPASAVTRPAMLPEHQAEIDHTSHSEWNLFHGFKTFSQFGVQIHAVVDHTGKPDKSWLCFPLHAFSPLQ